MLVKLLKKNHIQLVPQTLIDARLLLSFVNSEYFYFGVSKLSDKETYDGYYGDSLFLEGLDSTEVFKTLGKIAINIQSMLTLRKLRKKQTLTGSWSCNSSTSILSKRLKLADIREEVNTKINSLNYHFYASTPFVYALNYNKYYIEDTTRLNCYKKQGIEQGLLKFRIEGKEDSGEITLISPAKEELYSNRPDSDISLFGLTEQIDEMLPAGWETMGGTTGTAYYCFGSKKYVKQQIKNSLTKDTKIKKLAAQLDKESGLHYAYWATGTETQEIMVQVTLDYPVCATEHDMLAYISANN